MALPYLRGSSTIIYSSCPVLHHVGQHIIYVTKIAFLPTPRNIPNKHEVALLAGVGVGVTKGAGGVVVGEFVDTGTLRGPKPSR